MTASHTVTPSPILEQISKHGILFLYGFGIRLRVHHGHLCADWGIGEKRHNISLPRVVRNLRRVVVIDSQGFATFDAIRWISEIGASMTFLDRRGKLLFASGPSAPSDARLRRSQHLAIGNGCGLDITRALIEAKLQGQERVAKIRLNDPITAQAIASFRQRLEQAATFEDVRWLEAQAAIKYFAALQEVPLLWPTSDSRRIPEHWKKIGTRHSPLTGGPRLAITPFHSILNYSFALLESETRLCLTALGLDAGLGFGLHADAPSRDSLVFDVLEPVRPQIEDWLLSWIMREPLRRANFFETSNGHCRLMSQLCSKLAETSATWSKLVAPWAELVATRLWDSTSPSNNGRRLPTPLTQRHRREAKGQPPLPDVLAPRLQRICRRCGSTLTKRQADYCPPCGAEISRTNMIGTAQRGRAAFANSPESRARLSASQKRQRAARRGWLASSLPAWLTQSAYREMIMPRLAQITVPTLARTMNVTEPYAAEVRKGHHIPHPMHWQSLARLVGVSSHE